MAKEKRSVADLDAELAALEAELAALEGKPKKAKRKTEAPAPAPAAAPEAPPAPEPSAPEEKRSRFALPKIGKKKAEPEPRPVAAAEPAREPAPVAAPAPAPAAEPAYDASLWREEEGAWVRTIPETAVPVIRRVLDADGQLVREEAASARDVDEARGVKAERGLGRLLRRK